MKAQRRVLFCTLGYEPGPVGGAERQARLQAEELTRRGWAVDVVTARDPGTASGRMGGVRIRRLPRWNRRPFRTLTYAAVLAAWLLGNVRHYDLVHVHLANWQADVVAVACRLFRVPMYVKLAAGGSRGEIARMRPVSWATRYVGVRWAGRVQATSNEIVEDLRRLGIPEHRIARIPNGLPSGTYAPASREARIQLREELGLPREGVLVLYAGRFARYKGVPDLLEAWRTLKPSRPASLVLVGEAAIDDPVDIPSTPGVIVFPWTSNVAPYLQACDIYTHPSHADGMPNAVLEAMSSGMAVIATRIAAIPEMITDRETGILVERGATTELQTAIGMLIGDAGLRRRLGKAAAARAHAEYPIERVVDRIEAAYTELLMPGAG